MLKVGKFGRALNYGIREIFWVLLIFSYKIWRKSGNWTGYGTHVMYFSLEHVYFIRMKNTRSTDFDMLHSDFCTVRKTECIHVYMCTCNSDGTSTCTCRKSLEFTSLITSFIHSFFSQYLIKSGTNNLKQKCTGNDLDVCFSKDYSWHSSVIWRVHHMYIVLLRIYLTPFSGSVCLQVIKQVYITSVVKSSLLRTKALKPFINFKKWQTCWHCLWMVVTW